MNQPPRLKEWTDVVASPPGHSAGNSLIESMGVYLPPKIVSTAEVRRACKHPISLPLERLTGIRNRCMAGDDTFSIDLAKQALW